MISSIQLDGVIDNCSQWREKRFADLSLTTTTHAPSYIDNSTLAVRFAVTEELVEKFKVNSLELELPFHTQIS